MTFILERIVAQHTIYIPYTISDAKLGVEAAESWTAHCTGVPPVVITAVKVKAPPCSPNVWLLVGLAILAALVAQLQFTWQLRLWWNPEMYDSMLSWLTVKTLHWTSNSVIQSLKQEGAPYPAASAAVSVCMTILFRLVLKSDHANITVERHLEYAAQKNLEASNTL